MKNLLLVAVALILLTTAGCGSQTKVTAQTKPTHIKPLALVYLTGFVQQPGTYNVPLGATYGDVIDLAGGLRPEADAAKIDASKIIDTTIQIYVPGINDADLSQNREEGSRSGPLPRADDSVVQGSGVQKAQVRVYRGQPALSLSSEEQQMLDLINRERANKGVKPLVADSLLVRAARMKSQDMIDNDYFAHESAQYGTPSELVSAQGVSYHYVGENIAVGGTVEQVHRSLMGSPGHRQNILNPVFTRIGIGIIRGQRGLTVSQEFIG